MTTNIPVFPVPDADILDDWQITVSTVAMTEGGEAMLLVTAIHDRETVEKIATAAFSRTIDLLLKHAEHNGDPIEVSPEMVQKAVGIAAILGMGLYKSVVNFVDTMANGIESLSTEPQNGDEVDRCATCDKVECPLNPAYQG